ncbi:MAG: Glu-tRNA(Gln) amidotransferase subunit GatE [candidate division Zixibacteria bacterium]|nr:Glu-tRNA(Gln) amidotransferase subunit GatE [Candidatus Tariuqbacter arcticus]
MRQQFTLNRTGGLEGVDFRALGFRCGLEIHHQIKTEKKLFCRCPAGRYSDEYQAEVLRHMRPTLSELGEYDGCALMEFKTKKEIVYRLNKESVCTYELDDNPPFPIDKQALDIAIEIALLLNCNIVGEIHISRKQYLDGSIPAGFQRTTIIGVDGWIPFKGRRIGIFQLALEEDACREVSDVGHRITFLTDRLSMPLIEVVTAPDMLDPMEAAQVGGVIGALLRLTGKVNRGYGAVRQDVNVSISGGKRVEIKGVPKLGFIPRLTGFEATRQKALLNLREELQRRGFKTEADIVFDSKDVSELIGEINHPPLREKFPQFPAVKAMCLKGFRGILATQLNPGWNFSSEVSGRLRVIACLDQQPNLAHTDPGDKYSLSSSDAKKVCDWFECGSDDAVVLVWGPAEDVETAISEIIIRLKEILQGVINETRQRLPNGLTDFERILPGPNRMYPDTDSPPTPITDEMIARISANLPETPPWVKMERFRKLGLMEDISLALIHSNYLEPLERALERFSTKAALLAQMILQYIPTESRRNGSEYTNDEISDFLTIIAQRNLSKEEAIALFRAKKQGINWKETLFKLDLHHFSDEEIDSAVYEVLENIDGEHINSSALVGIIKGRFDGTVSGKRIHQRLMQINET